MKKTIVMLMCIMLMLTLTVSAHAANTFEYTNGEYGFSLTLTDEYTVIDRNTLSKNKDFIEKIGYSVSSFSAKLEQSSIVMYAATQDNSRQVQVKQWTSDFSTEVGALSALSDDRLSTALEVMARPIVGNDNELISSAVGEVGDITYLCYTVRVGQAFCYTEYVTVAGGKCYSLVYYNSSANFSEEESAERDKFISSLSISDASASSIWGGYSLTVRIVSAALIIAAASFAVYLVITFVRDFKRRRNSPEIIPDHIQMKYK